MIDRLGKELRVGDVVSIPSYDHGTTLRVVCIDDGVMVVKKCYRGRKIFTFRFPTFGRCDFVIVNR